MKNLISLKIWPVLLIVLFVLTFSSKGSGAVPGKQDYYEIRIYHISKKTQEERTDGYLKDVFIPALHRSGIAKIGVFKPIETDTAYGKLIYVFIPFTTMDQFVQLPEILGNDKTYNESAKSFADAPHTDPPYNRFESILLKAFMGMPQFMPPVYSTPVTERIYELRSYESATDAKAVKKIEMFNLGGEVKIFNKLGFNALFFGEVLIGSHMPNLMYMITFSNMASHDTHWAAFRVNPDWKTLSSLEEYKNTVSKTSPYFLHPTSYSDF